MERLKFTLEFKFEAVKLIRECGVTVAQAARDLGVHGTVLRVADFMLRQLTDRSYLRKTPGLSY